MFDSRDRRLDYALDLLTPDADRRRSGALPLLAVSGLVLAGALLATIVNGQGRPSPAPEAPPATISVSAPKADFELSGSSAVAPPATQAVPAGQEPQR